MLIIFYTLKIMLGCKIIYILLIIEKTTGMSHLKIRDNFVYSSYNKTN